MQPHRRQPIRRPHPWGFLGKNTGGDCHFLLQSMKVKVKTPSHVQPSATPWTAIFQAPPSMGFSRQEYWSGVLLPSPFTTSSNYLFHIIFTCLLCFPHSVISSIRIAFWMPAILIMDSQNLTIYFSFQNETSKY